MKDPCSSVSALVAGQNKFKSSKELALIYLIIQLYCQKYASKVLFIGKGLLFYPKYTVWLAFLVLSDTYSEGLAHTVLHCHGCWAAGSIQPVFGFIGLMLV